MAETSQPQAAPPPSKPSASSAIKFGQRHVLVIWLFLGFMEVYILRVCINTAIVAMVKTKLPNNTATPISTNFTSFLLNVTANPNAPAVCPYPDAPKPGNTSGTVARVGEFEWDKATQGIVLSSYYYGYICTQFIGGFLPRLIGGRLVYGVGVGGASVLTILHPVVTRSSVQGLVALRVLVGFFSGVTFSCNSFLLSNWVPKNERSTLGALAPAGSYVGTIVAAAISGVLCDYGFDGGWPTVFYIWGILGCLWTVGWFLSVHDTPQSHPRITHEERHYIQEHSGALAKPVPFKEIPWKSILLSLPVWGLICAQTAYTWNYFTCLTLLSTYLKDVQHISPSLNGVMTAIPYVCILVISSVSAVIADVVRVKTKLSIVWIRKIWYIFGMCASSIILIVIGYAGCDIAAVAVLFCLTVGLLGFAYTTWIVNHLDIATHYAGITMGIANTFGSVPGIVSPIVASQILAKESSVATWQIVFYISAAISFFGAIMFGIFGHAEVQHWAQIVPHPAPEPTPAPAIEMSQVEKAKADSSDEDEEPVKHELAADLEED